MDADEAFCQDLTRSSTLLGLRRPWPSHSPSRLWPIVVLSQPSALIFILAPPTPRITDSLKRALLSYKGVTMETKNNA